MAKKKNKAWKRLAAQRKPTEDAALRRVYPVAEALLDALESRAEK
ncbi:hypothetical protein [Streptomyces sp. G2]|nr:hypothetical protein [Streptomyces sp. G2]